MHLATRQNHIAAARFLALASKARRIALDSCIDWIENDIVIPEYSRIDTASARYYADQARSLRERALAARNGIRT